MQVTGAGSTSLLNNVNTVQAKVKGDFAETLAKATEQAQQAKDDAKLKDSCREMEAVFLNIMLANMRKTVDKSKLTDSSQEDMLTSMLDSETTKDMAKAGGIGLADMLYRQLHTAAPAGNRSQAPK